MSNRGQEAQRAVSSLVNGGGSDELRDFVDAMARDHRTLQQGFTRVCVAWLKRLAAAEHYDLRNEASVNLAREVSPILDKYPLPLI